MTREILRYYRVYVRSDFGVVALDTKAQTCKDAKEQRYLEGHRVIGVKRITPDGRPF